MVCLTIKNVKEMKKMFKKTLKKMLKKQRNNVNMYNDDFCFQKK